MIFKKSKNFENHADTESGAQYYNMWDKYAMSYKLAGETIANKIKNDKSDIDYLVYPLVYLYRHYFELRIKEILVTSQGFSEEKIEIPFNHDLKLAWKTCVIQIKKIRPKVLISELKNVEKVLDDFHKYDQGSFSFRYPIDKKEKATLNSLNYIDVTLFLEAINSSVYFLENISPLISATIDFKDIIQDDFE